MIVFFCPHLQRASNKAEAEAEAYTEVVGRLGPKKVRIGSRPENEVVAIINLLASELVSYY